MLGGHGKSGQADIINALFAWPRLWRWLTPPQPTHDHVPFPSFFRASFLPTHPLPCPARTCPTAPQTNTAAVMTHLPTRVTGEGNERRSQMQNASQAYKRLRLALASSSPPPPHPSPAPAATPLGSCRCWASVQRPGATVGGAVASVPCCRQRRCRCWRRMALPGLAGVAGAARDQRKPPPQLSPRSRPLAPVLNAGVRTGFAALHGRLCASGQTSEAPTGSRARRSW